MPKGKRKGESGWTNAGTLLISASPGAAATVNITEARVATEALSSSGITDFENAEPGFRPEVRESQSEGQS